MTRAPLAIAKHVLTTRFEDLPPAAVDAAKIFILDSLGVGIAGYRAPFAAEVRTVAESWGGVPDGLHGARILGSGLRLPAPSAAFANGFQIHCQEYDCVHEPAVVHPMATVLSAILAAADDQGGVSGKELITAVCVAVDVAAGLGISSKVALKFFRPATAGIFGATCGVARLKGLSESQLLDALGTALGQAAGTMQAHVEGKPTLPLQIGFAARAAHVAVALGQAGVPSSHDSLEGPFGYMTLFEGDYDLTPWLQSLGQVWRITEVSHKAYPTGRAAQGGIEAVQKLLARGLDPKRLTKLTVTAPPLIHRLVGRPPLQGMAVNYARLCFAYLGAVALTRGSVGLSDFAPERLNDPDVLALAQKITVINDGNPDPAAFVPEVIEAHLDDGSQMAERIDALIGSPANPLSRDAHLAKFRACCDYRGLSSATAMIELAGRLETLPDTRSLIDLACPTGM